ncbi:hypothetical protein B0H34DRAFT_687161 [Crassisporium funariophilum]|nr:hypothetical protein B0H34DRAFT_687161 [Crassisporium funariophilum]
MFAMPWGRTSTSHVAPDEEIRPFLELYFLIGRNDVEIADLLKSHYDTNLYGISVK